jgi:hypothetical protein
MSEGRCAAPGYLRMYINHTVSLRTCDGDPNHLGPHFIYMDGGTVALRDLCGWAEDFTGQVCVGPVGHDGVHTYDWRCDRHAGCYLPAWHSGAPWTPPDRRVTAVPDRPVSLIDSEGRTKPAARRK